MQLNKAPVLSLRLSQPRRLRLNRNLRRRLSLLRRFLIPGVQTRPGLLKPLGRRLRSH